MCTTRKCTFVRKVVHHLNTTRKRMQSLTPQPFATQEGTSGKLGVGCAKGFFIAHVLMGDFKTALKGIQSNLRTKDTLGPRPLSSLRRLSSFQRLSNMLSLSQFLTLFLLLSLIFFLSRPLSVCFLHFVHPSSPLSTLSI